MSDEQDKVTEADLKKRGIKVVLRKMGLPHIHWTCALSPPEQPAGQFAQSDTILSHGDSRSKALESAYSLAKNTWPDLFD